MANSTFAIYERKQTENIFISNDTHPPFGVCLFVCLFVLLRLQNKHDRMLRDKKTVN